MIEETVPTKTKETLRVLNDLNEPGNNHVILYAYSIKLFFGFDTNKSLTSNRL